MKRLKELKAKAQCKLYALKEKRENGSHLLEVLGAIIIAVVLLFLFKDKIIEIFNNAMNSTNTEITDLFSK